MLDLPNSRKPPAYRFSYRPHAQKSAGDLASSPHKCGSSPTRTPSSAMPRLCQPYCDGGSDHAKMLRSTVVRMISSCSRRKAFPSSPYSSGMLRSKIPYRQYAVSSIRVVVRLAAHDIFWATHTASRVLWPSRTDWSILVMVNNMPARSDFVPSRGLLHSESKKMT